MACRGGGFPVSRLWRRLPRLRRAETRRRYDERLREEMEEHLALQTAENLRAGMSPREARRQAKLKFGAVEAIREQYQSEVGGLWVRSWLEDVRYAARTLAKSPGFTAVTVLTLALGTGANAAIFSIVDAVLLRPLPYARPGQLVSLSEAEPKEGIAGAGMSWTTFTVLHDHSRSFNAVAGLARHALTLTGQGEPADESTVAVTGDFFTLFGTKAVLGRMLAPEDDRDGAPPVAVLSEDLWRSRFGGERDIVGRTIELDERSFTVAGVAAASFRTPFVGKAEQVWIPLSQDPLFSHWKTRPPSAHWLPAIARLRPGVSTAEAQAELRTMGAGLAQQFSEEREWQPRMKPLRQAIVGDVQLPLLLLMGAVGLVLLIACANIANLLLARATARAKELGVRVALGASRGRIARQLLTESALLGVLGGAAGALLAWASVTGFASALPAALPRFHPIRVDGAVLGFTLALALAASLVFGLAPVLRAARSDPQTDLREGARAGEARGAQRARNFLAAAEVAVAMVLLAGTGLLLRSFGHLLAVSPGFATEHLVKAEVSLPRYQYTKPEQWTAFADELMTRLRVERGFEDSAIGIPLPIVDDAVNLPFTIVGNAPLAQGRTPTADYVAAGPRYFAVMGIGLMRGRLFTADDTAMTPAVAVISQSLARRYFPHEDPLGRQMVFGFPPYGNVAREVVGVVADIHDVSLAEKPRAVMYVPFAQAPFWGAEVVVRSGRSAAEVAAAIRTETHRIDAGVPVTDVATLPEALRASVAEPRFRTTLLAVFGCLALVLATVGIYGVISFSVSRRTREIGVRVALGATPANLGRLVIGESVMLALVGLAAGIPAALLLTHWLSSLLFGVNPGDPLTFTAVAFLLTLGAAAAAYVPARRAMRVDPMTALRCE